MLKSAGIGETPENLAAARVRIQFASFLQDEQAKQITHSRWHWSAQSMFDTMIAKLPMTTRAGQLTHLLEVERAAS
jgi:hypothetical protein